MSSLMERMLKTGASNTGAVTLTESVIFDDSISIPTAIPALNIALSGSIKSGITPGITIFAAPSRHFKTGIGLTCVSAYMKHYPESICLFYDSEFGANQSYFDGAGIDSNRVIHIPIDNLETFKFDIMKKLEDLSKNDKVIIFVDSLGNIPSKKEIEDAESEKSSADMTRAKVLKSVMRMITIPLATKNIPFIAVNHVYQEIGLYPKTIMGGGTGPLLAAQNVIFVSRAQDKAADGTIEGYDFTLIAEKSRLVKEKSKIPLNVRYEGGINRWSGLLDIAIECGIVIKPKQGWYTRPCVEGDKNWRAKDTDSADFWVPVFQKTDFAQKIESIFKVPANSSVAILQDDIEDIIGE